MSKRIHCEECTTTWRSKDIEALDRFDLRSTDGTHVGDYCSVACLVKGAEGWLSAADEALELDKEDS